MTDRKIVTAYFLSILVLSFISYLTYSLEGGQRILYLGEGGIVETLSAVGYLLCIAYALYKGSAAYLKQHVFLIIAMLMLVARELDLDKQFTTKGVLTIKLYVHQDASILEKGVGIFVIILLVATIIMIIKKYTKPILNGIKERSIVTFGIVMTMGMLVFSKTIDGLPRKLEPFGIEFTDLESIQLGGVEEVFEMGIPLFIFLTFYSYFRNKKLNAPEI